MRRGGRTGCCCATLQTQSWQSRLLNVVSDWIFCFLVVLDFTLTIQRRPGFYVTYLYIPSVVIIASSLFAFYLPPGSDAKVDLAVTGLLSQTVFLLLISDLMPPDAYNPPFLGKWRNIHYFYHYYCDTFTKWQTNIIQEGQFPHKAKEIGKQVGSNGKTLLSIFSYLKWKNYQNKLNFICNFFSRARKEIY